MNISNPIVVGKNDVLSTQKSPMAAYYIYRESIKLIVL
jgi:hypothetical protein